MGRPKRKSEGVKQEGGDSKRHKTTAAKELAAFFQSTIEVVSSMPNAVNFIRLPPKKILPDYYDVIASPISIHEIKAKVNSYDSTDDFVADFQLMADNANTYNLEESEIAQDSILILDFVKDQVNQRNSELEPTDPSPPPPPPPKEESPEPVPAPIPVHKESTPAKSSLKIKIKPPLPPSTPSTPSVQTPGTPGTATGMTQKARFLMVLDELMNYEVDGTNIGAPFSKDVLRRDFPDYYKVVKKPMTLGNVKENILAGKVKSMGQFQNQVELVWKNAQLYHDVGSLLHSDARVLQDYFHTRMAEINKEIEANRMAQLQERSTPSGGSSGIRLKIKPPKTKLSLTLHNRDGGLQIPGDGYLNPLTGEDQRPDDDEQNSSADEEPESVHEEEEEAKPESPPVVLPSTRPRLPSKPASEAFIQEILITSSRNLYKQLLRPISATATPIQHMQSWFEHKILAADYPVSSYTIPLHRQQGAVSVSAGLNDDLIEKKHHAFLTVNGERVSPVPSIHYADSGRQLTSRYEIKLPLGLNMVVIDLAVEDPVEESRSRIQEAPTMTTERMTLWIQVL